MPITRYTGEILGSNSSIAVIANDAIGNFAVATIILAKLRESFPDSRRFLVNGSRTAEFGPHLGNLAEFVSIWGNDPSKIDPGLRVDHVINLEVSPAARVLAGILAQPDGFITGPCVASDLRGDFAFQQDDRGELWKDQNWISPDITSRYRFLKSGFIGELFCRLAYLDGDIPGYSIPSLPPRIQIPDVVFSTSASLSTKLWISDHWIRLANSIRLRGFSVGLVGASPKLNRHFWHGADSDEQLLADGGVWDLRGKLTLPEVVGALAKARLVVSLDNGIMHCAAASSTPIVALFRNGIHRLWAPPAPSLSVVLPEPSQPVSTIPYEDVERTVLSKLD